MYVHDKMCSLHTLKLRIIQDKSSRSCGWSLVHRAVWRRPLSTVGSPFYLYPCLGLVLLASSGQIENYNLSDRPSLAITFSIFLWQNVWVCRQCAHFTTGTNEQNQHFAVLRQKVSLYIHVVVLQSGLQTWTFCHKKMEKAIDCFFPLFFRDKVRIYGKPKCPKVGIYGIP